ncbi:hypothetical protein DPMN_071081 [Dreissena polymorpha]|uniref:TIR domain-containing protein n=1 Tax=Dreissena polymorpha TaxID=45954 RepID=A0A9D3Z3X5_DREPO|nr:hypothetical protein DPMN_071081 [Dreissena polymorpha]
MTEKECRPPNPLLPGYIATGCSSFVIIVLVVVAFWNRWYLQYYWHRIKKRFKRKDKERDPERQPFARPRRPRFLFDAYVTNSDADGPFEDNLLVPLVQDKLGYTVHTSNKDGAIGGSKADDYFDAMDVSKSVIVVFSNSLMKDAWCTFQVDIALMRRIESKGKRNIFVVVMNNTEMLLANKSYACS